MNSSAQSQPALTGCALPRWRSLIAQHGCPKGWCHTEPGTFHRHNLETSPAEGHPAVIANDAAHLDDRATSASAQAEGISCTRLDFCTAGAADDVASLDRMPEEGNIIQDRLARSRAVT